ncbi:S8 family peptidase [Larkinella sp. C7]|jgi:hypothetical protein|uniref:S8 family peptidase n=1 Tax=Larkinella sp. C7 TaxID=2576607 RepID=UPI0011113F3C|nr:S8 family peptidase [Larkinella sp. C7]
MGFEHLSLREKKVGKPKTNGGGKESQGTSNRKLNFNQHGSTLRNNYGVIRREWADLLKEREALNLPPVLNPNQVPIFLRIDPDCFDIEFIRKAFNIEIVSERDNGYIIGVSTDNFIGLEDKIQRFLTQRHGGARIALLWDIESGHQWRIDEILSESLLAKWDLIDDKVIYQVDVGIACNIVENDPPKRRKTESNNSYAVRLAEWRNERSELYDARSMQRQNDFERFVGGIAGRIVGSMIDLNDSFGCRVELTGAGLKDLVLTYPFLFDVSEAPVINIPDSENSALPTVFGANITAPLPDAPRVCVIDSGIMEGHQLLHPAIDSAASYCFIDGHETDVADEVRNGGHGTKVAGAILYPDQIPVNGTYELPFWIQNAKILDSSNILSDSVSPSELMIRIVERYQPTKIFNLSIAAHIPCEQIHMSEWAATLDQLIWKHDVIFVTAVGNIRLPEIVANLQNAVPYPDYLIENTSSRLSEPSQSSFSLAVGSVCLDGYEDEDLQSFGQKDDPSSFSKTGPGMWGTVKPDVVEYGGDWIRKKQFDNTLTTHHSICPALIRSTLHGGYFVGRDDKGTSFAAPKVTHILAALQQLLPTTSVMLYRALLVQSARLPKEKFLKPTGTDLRLYGYGIPSKTRALGNQPNRATLFASDSLSGSKAHIYTVAIPEEIRRQGDEYSVLLEITLAFKAKPRRTRRKTNSYLSTWLSWESTKIGESYDEFAQRVVEYLDGEPFDTVEQRRRNYESIPWSIRTNVAHGDVRDFRRQDSTLQKDWCVIPSNKLIEEFSIAIVGHKGWDKDPDAEVPYSIVVSFEYLNADINVYEKIRIANEVEIQIQQQV